MKTMIHILKSLTRSLILKHRVLKANNKVKSPTTTLTKEEKKQIIKEWSNYPVYKGYLNSFAFYKAFNGTIDYKYIPSGFFILCEMTLNPCWAKDYLQQKCLLKDFIPTSNRPETILQRINGHLYDCHNNPIKNDKAIDLLSTFDEFVYKPAKNTGSGRGVKKIVTSQNPDYKKLFELQDFLIQKIVKQDEFMASFNSSSLNTIRMTTLNLNDNFSFLSSFIRIGGKGNFVDNITNNTGCVVGINENGVLSNYGLTNNYTKVYSSPSGMKFNNLSIHNYSAIKDTIKEFHKNIPFINIINWDIAINHEGEIIIIEINLDSMNPRYHQIFNGPYFKDRFDEVREYVKKRIIDINLTIKL